MVSTSSNAGCLARSIAWRTAPTRLATPVEVSLCTTITALNACTVSAAGARATSSGANAVAPLAGNDLDGEPEPLGERAPQRGEMPGFERQHRVARRQRVDQAGF